MPKRSPRKLEAFVMHAHHDTPATYTDLFERLRKLRPEARIYKFTEEVVLGFPVVSKEDDNYFLQSVLGNPEAALVLNTETGNTRENILARSEMLSHATHIVASPRKRRAAIEYSQRGAKPRDKATQANRFPIATARSRLEGRPDRYVLLPMSPGRTHKQDGGEGGGQSERQKRNTVSQLIDGIDISRLRSFKERPTFVLHSYYIFQQVFSCPMRKRPSIRRYR